MNIFFFSLFVALEVALLLAVLVVFLNRKNKRLQQELEEFRQPAVDDEQFESIASGYLPYLEKQIIDTQLRFELQQSESGDDERLELALTQRLALLEAEKKVAEHCNDYPERRWEHVMEYFAPQQIEEEPEPEAAVEQVEGTEAAGSVGQLVNVFGQQGNALVSLRSVFDQVREKPDTETLDELENQLKELERRFGEANTCVEMMEQENQRLQDQMEKEEQRMDKARHEDAVEFAQQLGKQKNSLSSLQGMVNDLQLEAGKAAELQEQLKQFESNAREMNLCIEIMEDENLFLRDQVQALLQADQAESLEQKKVTTDNEELSNRIEALQSELEEKQGKLSELERRYAEMEKEYQLLYEKAQSENSTY